MHAARRLKLMGALALLGACADLETLPGEVCGNGVVEPAKHEDCEPLPGSSCIAAGLPNECHWRCGPAASDPQCPGDMVCAVDGVCVYHAGVFAQSAETRVRADTALATGDLDDDGLTDLLLTGAAQVGVVHTTSEGKLESPIEFPVSAAGPVIARVTSDGIDDLVAGHGGLFVQRGSTERSYGPVTYSPVAWPEGQVSGEVVVMDALPPSYDSETDVTRHLGDEVLWVGPDGFRALDELTLGWSESWDLEGHTLEVLDPDWIVADLWQRPVGADCDELLVHFAPDARRLWVVSPCGAGSDVPSDQGLPLAFVDGATIEMPLGCAPDRGIVATDVNGDGYLDVVIGSSCPAPPSGELGPGECVGDVLLPNKDGASLWVAYGHDSGILTAADPAGGGPLPTEGCNVVAVMNPGLEELLAQAYLELGDEADAEPILLGATDFNRDGLPDFVLRDGTIAMSSAAGEPSGEGGSTPIPVGGAGGAGGGIEAAGGGSSGGGVEPVRSIHEATYLALRYGDVRRWTAAHIVDFNGNGLPDVIAGVAGREELLFLNGTPSGLLNKIKIPLLGEPKELVVGDFDGDLLPDVAFAEAGTPDVLSICYGQPFGAPTAPYRIGEVGRALSIAKGNLPLGGLDGLDDLIVTTEPTEGGPPTLALLLGSYDGMPFSPLFFTRSAAQNGALQGDGGSPPEINNPVYDVDLGFVATSVAVGDLNGDGHPDVAALTAPGTRADTTQWMNVADHHLWSIPMTGDAQTAITLVQAMELTPQTIAGLPPDVDASRALIALLDLGGDAAAGGQAKSEVIGLATSVPDPGDPASLRGTIIVAEPIVFDDATGACVLSPTQVLADLDLLFAGPPPHGLDHAESHPLPWEKGGKLEVGDVTGDGHGDLVVLAGWYDGSKPIGQQVRTRVVAFPNTQVSDLTAALDYWGRIEFPSPDPEQSFDPAQYGDPASFALWQADADPELELFVVTAPLQGGDATGSEDAALVLRVDLEPGSTAPRSIVELGEASGGRLAGGLAVAVGYFDGDRLFDLAVVRATPGETYGNLALLLGQPLVRN